MSIREADPEDISNITKDLWLPLAREMEQVSEYNQLSSDLDLDQVEDYRREKLEEAGDRTTFLFEEDNKPVAYLTIDISEPAPVFSRQKEGHIIELYVKKNYRNRGIASKLIDKATEFAEERNCDNMALEVNVENPPAKKLYQKRGFETEREKMIKKL